MISKERPTTSTVLASIGEDAATLAEFKYHAGLDTDPSWTEADGLLKSYLLAAQKYIDYQTGQPYNLMEFTQRYRRIQYCDGRHFLVPAMWPIVPTTTALVGRDNLGNVVNYVENTDYEISNGPKPAIVMNYGFSPPVANQVLYPWTLSYSAGGEQNEMQRTTIFQLAAYYQRFPEGIGKAVPDGIFQSHLDALDADGFL